MEQFPIQLEGKSVGQLMMHEEPLYWVCEAVCHVTTDSIWRITIIGEKGSFRLGVPEPAGDSLKIRRRVSKQEISKLGKIVNCTLSGGSTVVQPTDNWTPISAPAELFRSSFLRERLQSSRDALTQEQNGVRLLALPMDVRQPFPLPALFCMAHLRCIRGHWHVVFAFNKKETPIFL